MALILELAGQALQMAIVVAIAPLLLGVSRKVKARLLMRIGPPLLQPYVDIWKLMHKEMVLAYNASWIYRITFNAAMSRLRTARYQRTLEEERQRASQDADASTGTQTQREPADWNNMADETLFRRQLRRRAFRAILALPVIYRAPVMLRDIQGMSTEEASAMLRVKDQTLKSRLHRGRLILRKQLADFAGGLTLHRPIYGV